MFADGEDVVEVMVSLGCAYKDGEVLLQHQQDMEQLEGCSWASWKTIAGVARAA